MFQGRALLFTNTLGCGVLMAAGDGARQSWEIRARPGQKFDPRRSGEKADAAGPGPQGTWDPTSDLEAPGPYPRAMTPDPWAEFPAGPLISASSLTAPVRVPPPTRGSRSPPPRASAPSLPVSLSSNLERIHPLPPFGSRPRPSLRLLPCLLHRGMSTQPGQLHPRWAKTHGGWTPAAGPCALASDSPSCCASVSFSANRGDGRIPSQGGEGMR